MQLYALDDKGHPISAQRARKQHSYRCLECQSAIRLRAGPHRQRHFYHLQPNRSCRLHKKGMTHLQIQLHLYESLPKGDCQLEYRIPSINRIADVAWLSKKIIFEIQYSFIAATEIEQRNRDYQSLGWVVVWILHDQRYNQLRVTAAELELRFYSHYFTNMNDQGQGIIYDQFDLIDRGLRKHKMRALPIEVTECRSFALLLGQEEPLRLITQRTHHWPLFFKGDLCSLSQQDKESSYLQEAREREAIFFEQVVPPLKRWQWIQTIFYKIVLHPYRVFFRLLLEKVCR